jgi:hypothetical protein
MDGRCSTSNAMYKRCGNWWSASNWGSAGLSLEVAPRLCSGHEVVTERTECTLFNDEIIGFQECWQTYTSQRDPRKYR